MSAARFHPAALRELIEAVTWYESQRPGLGEAFETEVYARLERALEAPGAGRLEPGAPPAYALRWYRVRRFPYGLLVGHAGGGPLVVAIAHERRRPQYWLGRVGADE